MRSVGLLFGLLQTVVVFVVTSIILLFGINTPAIIIIVTTITNSYFLHPVFDSRCFLRMLRAHSVFLYTWKEAGREKEGERGRLLYVIASSSCRKKGVYLVLFFLQ